jgi:hypothetical protein
VLVLSCYLSLDSFAYRFKGERGSCKFIEMKRQGNGGKLSVDQRKWLLRENIILVLKEGPIIN